MRFCVLCGAMNEDDSRFCIKCGNPIENDEAPAARVAIAPIPATAHVKREKSTPVAAIAVIVIVALAVAGAIVYCALNGVLDLPFLPTSGQNPSSAAAEPAAQRVYSDSANAAACSSLTKIVPLDSDENPWESYKAVLKAISGGTDVNVTLQIDGTGGFSIADFADPNAKGSAAIKEGTYKLVMTNAASGYECVLRVSYKPTDHSAASIVEVIAAK